MSILTVVVEDTAALLGIGVAAAGIFLTDITGNTVYDAIRSIIMGGFLMAFAFFLAKKIEDYYWANQFLHNSEMKS